MLSYNLLAHNTLTDWLFRIRFLSNRNMDLKILIIGIPMKTVILIALQRVNNPYLVELDSSISYKPDLNLNNYV